MIRDLQLLIFCSTVVYAALLVCVLVWWKPQRLLPHNSDGDFKPQLTVVLAARNEAENIGSCLRSILNQSVVSQVIVVDDHSTDTTAAIVDSLRGQDQRVVLLAAPELPPAWVGKSHALDFGAKEVGTPYLLFTDADVIFGPGILAAALRKMDDAKLAHLGGHFFVDCQTIAEEICTPVLVLSSGLALFGTAKSLGAGTGAFNLMRTAMYHACGGHSPIKNNLVDDVALARHLKTCGAKSEFVAMDDYLKVRLFIGFAGFVNSVARSAVPFLRLGGLTVCLLTILCMILASLPVISMIAAIYQNTATPIHVSTGIALFFGVLPYGLGFAAVTRSRQLHNGRLIFLMCYPLSLFLLAGSVFWAGLGQMRHRPVSWRGRTYASPLANRRPKLD